MRNLSAKEKALVRMAMRDETALLQDGNNNTSPDVGAAYPRMMYKATTEEDRFMQTDAHAKCGETYLVQNLFHGLLCDTIIAEDADEAEALVSQGWDSSPQAAHGIASGLATVTSAKDARIAELEAMLAERTTEEAPRRGSPPKQPGEELPSV
jgi:hypothetical protein